MTVYNHVYAVEANQNTVHIPLTYQARVPYAALYFMHLNIGVPIQLHRLIVDTGGGNEILVFADKKHCLSCSSIIPNPTRYTPGNSAQLLKNKSGKPLIYKTAYLPYGFAYGKYVEDTVQVSALQPVRAAVIMGTKMKNIVNDLGMGYTNSLFSLYREKYNFPFQFGLTLCQTKSGSMMTWGREDNPKYKTRYYSPLYLRKLNQYVVKPSYLRDKLTQQRFGMLPQPHSKKVSTMLDSGTTQIVLPARIMNKLITFLKNDKNIKKHHFPASFWPAFSRNGEVVDFPDSFVKDFPVLQVGLQDATHSHTFHYYNITPQTYLVKIEPYRRYFGFSYPAKKTADYAILGNVFLANYHTEYYLTHKKNWSKDAKVGFASIKGLCG